MTIIQIGKKLFPFPQQWNDLSRRQLLRIMNILVNHQDMTVDDAKARFFKILSNASWLRLLLFPLDVQENIHLVEWIYEPQPDKLYTKNLIPHFRGMYGPADEFSNLCALEFFWAQHFYDKWADTKDVQHLNKMVATLYRPTSLKAYMNRVSRNDVRVAYNPNYTETYEKQVAEWPMLIKESIAKFFEHSFLNIRRRYPEPFVGTGDGSIDPFGFVSLFRGVAERKIHGDFKDIEHMNLDLFFIELSSILRADRKLN